MNPIPYLRDCDSCISSRELAISEIFSQGTFKNFVGLLSPAARVCKSIAVSFAYLRSDTNITPCCSLPFKNCFKPANVKRIIEKSQYLLKCKRFNYVLPWYIWRCIAINLERRWCYSKPVIWISTGYGLTLGWKLNVLLGDAPIQDAIS